jgi:branched-chain amino acid transport system substrate-binding protein
MAKKLKARGPIRRLAMKRLMMLVMAVMVAAILWNSVAMAQQPDKVTIAIPIEQSGAGAVVGLRWIRGVEMAVGDINKTGGILGKKVETFTLDTKTEPPVAVAAVRKAVESKPFVIMGPIYSGSALACMGVAKDAGIPQFVGSESPNIGRQNNPNIFLTTNNSENATRMVVDWLTNVVKVRKMGIMYANNDFGKAGRDALMKLLQPKGVEFVADIATEQGQTSFSGEISRVKASAPDSLFVYMNEEESARALRQIKEAGLDKQMRLIGSTTLMNVDVIRLAKDAVNGVEGFIGETYAAPAFKSLNDRYVEQFKELPDHNFFKAYMGMMTVKAVADETKSFDQQKFRDKLHNNTLCVKDHPEILMDVHYLENGDLERPGFVVKVVDQKHTIVNALTPLRPEWFSKCK